MSAKNKIKLSKAFSMILALMMVFGIVMPLIHIDASAAAPTNYTTIHSNSTASVSLNSSTTAQYFKFSPVISGSYKFYSSNNSGDPYVEILDSSGTQITYNDDGAGNRNFSITTACYAGSVYYIKARSYSSGSSTSYTLNVSAMSLSYSELITSETSEYLNLSVDEYKVYKFIPDSSMTYDIISEDSSGDPAVILCDQYGKEITRDNDGNGGKDFLISYSFTAGTTYYIKAMNAPFASSSYTFKVSPHTSSSTPSNPTTSRDVPLFNSGATSSSGYDRYMTTNPAPSTYTNNGYDLYGTVGTASARRFRLGLSFTVADVVTELSTLSVMAYDVDEDVKACSHGYEYDYIYLVDETSGNSTRLNGHLSGQDNTWNNSVFSIDPSLFTVGHTYHFELEMSCTGSTSCTYYSVTVRTVALQLGIASSTPSAPEGIEEADLTCSISTTGTVSTALTAKAYTSGSYTLEYKVVYTSDSSQRGGAQQTVTIPDSSTRFTYTFSLDSGSPRGTYVVTVFIKDGDGNVKATRNVTVSYGYSAVSYNSNGGSQNLPTDTNAYSSGNTVSVLFNYVPSRAGYTFLGWSTSSTATTPEYTANGNNTFTIGSSDVTLYAVWQEDAVEPPVVEPPVEPPVVDPADVWDGSVANGFGGGTGTSSDPYLINTAAELAYLARSVNSGTSYSGKYFKLMSNLDLGGLEWTPIGNSDSCYFQGRFDGNYHVIYNTSITLSGLTSSIGAGLFGVIENASISNLGIEDYDYNISGGRIGGLCGIMINSTVANCYATGSIHFNTNNNGGANGGGGLIGDMRTNSTLRDSYAKCNISVVGWSSEYSFAGGLVGFMCSEGSKAIQRCYADSEITCTTSNTAGGLVGEFFYGAITLNNCFSNSTVDGSQTRMLVGCKDVSKAPTYSVTNCYFTSGGYDAFGGISTSYDNFTSSSWLSATLGWDLTDVWQISAAGYLPTLRGFTSSTPSTPSTPPASCDHSEYDVVVDTQPTCTENGVGHAVCKNCGETLEAAVTIPSPGHSFYVYDEMAETCTENGYVIFACNNCSYTRTQIIYATGHDFGTDNVCDECGYEVESHTHEYTETVIAPTCTTVGYTVYECSCGHTYRTDYIDQTGHRWGSGEITTERSCTTEGVKTYTCSECGETRVEIIPAGHDWSESVTVEKTCETDGEITRTCNDCGETETEVIPAGHTWLDGTVITEPTCTEPGTKEVACSVCGASETQEIDVLGHTFVNGRCTRCGAGIEDVVTPNEGHPEYGMYFEIDDILSNYGPDPINEYGVLLDYNEGANIQKVGVYLVQDGTMWRRCIACVGEGITYATYVPYLSYDEDIKYTGLNSPYINIFRLKENSDGIWCYSNYTTIGVNLQNAYGNLLLSLYDIGQAGAKTRVFDNLEEMINWLLEPDCSGHVAGDWIIDSEPGCSTEGEMHKECTECGTVMETETIPATGEHTESEWIIDEEPTCVSDGSRHKECTECGETLTTEIIPSSGEHTEGEWIIDREPNCIAGGSRHKECTVCHEILAVEILPADGVHTEGEWIIDEEPTCESEGYKHTECTVCSTVISTDTILPTGEHTEGEWIIDREAQCMIDGSQHKECINCGMIIVTDIIIAPGYHTESDWIIDSEPTAAEYGSKHIECTECHAVLRTESIERLVTLTIGNVSAVRGGRVNVDVVIENSPGIAGAVLTFEYDNALTLVDATAGEAWKGLSLTKPAAFQSPCNFVWDGNGAYDNGTVITLTFELPDDAYIDQIYSISASYMPGNILDTDYNNVDLTVIAGSITVQPMYGDVNDDGTVDVADVIALRRYLAGGYDIVINEELADMNRDGFITIVDVIEIRRYILETV